jgi:hypothetical protein
VSGRREGSAVCVCVRVCVCITGVCEWEEGGLSCGIQHTVGSVTHGPKIKKLLEVFTGPRMTVNPTGLAPGQKLFTQPPHLLHWWPVSGCFTPSPG